VTNFRTVVGSVGCLHEAMPVLRLRCPIMCVGASGTASSRQRQMVRALRMRVTVGLGDSRFYAQEMADVLLIHVLSGVRGNLVGQFRQGSALASGQWQVPGH
jgi:hypothetical protein